VIPKVKRTA
jgi:hypothetical protein